MDRETQLQTVVSIVVVLLFIGVLAVVSTTFSTDGSVTADGGYALVAALFAFVVVISGAGLLVTRSTGEDESDSGEDS
jgi:peptidoglycan/LPS O-acetylase OafA/YrhL